MVIGIGLIVVVAFFIVSIVFAIISPGQGELRSAMVWALWAILLALIFGAHVAV